VHRRSGRPASQRRITRSAWRRAAAAGRCARSLNARNAASAPAAGSSSRCARCARSRRASSSHEVADLVDRAVSPHRRRRISRAGRRAPGCRRAPASSKSCTRRRCGRPSHDLALRRAARARHEWLRTPSSVSRHRFSGASVTSPPYTAWSNPSPGGTGETRLRSVAAGPYRSRARARSPQ